MSGKSISEYRRNVLSDEERLRKKKLSGEEHPPVNAGIVPQGKPGAEGRPVRRVPVGGIASVPKYGQISYTRNDGSRRVVDSTGDRNISNIPGVGLVATPSSTPMHLTPNNATNITDKTPVVPPLNPGAGEQVRRNAVTGAEVVMPEDAWARRDANRRVRLGGGIVPRAVDPDGGQTDVPDQRARMSFTGGVVPQDPGLGVAGQTQGAVASGIVASQQRPPSRWEQFQARRDREMERERYARRPGATSANLRQWDQEEGNRIAREHSTENAERAAGLVRGQQETDVTNARTLADASTTVAKTEADASRDVAQTQAEASRDVAETEVGGVKYVADKELEAEDSRHARETAAALHERVESMRLKAEEMRRKYPDNPEQITDEQLKTVLDPGVYQGLRAYRKAKQVRYHEDDRKNRKMMNKALEKVSQEFFDVKDPGYLERLDDAMGVFVDIADHRYGASKWDEYRLK